jgi:hypothetical protein
VASCLSFISSGYQLSIASCVQTRTDIAPKSPQRPHLSLGCGVGSEPLPCTYGHGDPRPPINLAHYAKLLLGPLVLVSPVFFCIDSWMGKWYMVHMHMDN